MCNETENHKFKYMLEFPNRIRIYATDEQFLSSLLQKYGMTVCNVSPDNLTSRVETRNKEPISELPTVSQCPDCESTKIVFDSEHGKAICTDCGCVLNQHSPREHFGIGSLDSHTGYKISENKKGHKLVCKPRNKASYTTYVNRLIVEEVYRLLKDEGKRISSAEIQKALKINNVYLHNALKVLIIQGRAEAERVRGRGRGFQFLYWAAQNEGHKEMSATFSPPVNQ